MRLWHLLIAALQFSARAETRSNLRASSNLRAGSLQRARPRAGSAVVACAGGGDDDEPPPMEGFEKFVDVSLGTISWAFLPIILFTGILLSPDFAAGRPIRIGAQSCDPLASPVLERRAASGDATSTSVR